MIRISPSLELPDGEVIVTFGPARGPGGQNVNKVHTAAILTFNIDTSPSLTEGQRSTLRQAFGPRISGAGELQLRSDRHRTQGDNRRDVMRRFVALVSAALRPRRPRVATRPTRGSRVRRLRTKRVRALRKRERSGRADAGE